MYQFNQNNLMIVRANMDFPLLGKKRILLEKIDSIDSKWHVEVWEEHYYFLRMEIYSRKREIVVRNKENNRRENLL